MAKKLDLISISNTLCSAVSTFISVENCMEGICEITEAVRAALLENVERLLASIFQKANKVFPSIMTSSIRAGVSFQNGASFLSRLFK